MISRRAATRLAAVMILPAICAACTPSRPGLIPPPATRLTCSDEPLAPADATPAAQVAYMAALRDAWHDCWSTVLWHRDFWEDAQ